jgi:hypothetical protein
MSYMILLTSVPLIGYHSSLRTVTGNSKLVPMSWLRLRHKVLQATVDRHYNDV